MKQTSEYIDLIKAHADEIRSQFGVRTLRLFGSVSRGEQREDSDVDVCVEMEPRIYLVVRLQRYLEQLLGCPVDLYQEAQSHESLSTSKNSLRQKKKRCEDKIGYEQPPDYHPHLVVEDEGTVVFHQVA